MPSLRVSVQKCHTILASAHLTPSAFYGVHAPISDLSQISDYVQLTMMRACARHERDET